MNSAQSYKHDAKARSWGPLLFTINFVGAAGYVVAASKAWVPAQERAVGLHSVTGEPFIWSLSVFPIWAVFILLNLIWGGFTVARRQRRSGIWWLMTIPVWLVAMAVDFTHH